MSRNLLLDRTDLIARLQQGKSLIDFTVRVRTPDGLKQATIVKIGQGEPYSWNHTNEVGVTETTTKYLIVRGGDGQELYFPYSAVSNH